MPSFRRFAAEAGTSTARSNLRIRRGGMSAQDRITLAAFGRYDYDFALAITLVIVGAILLSEAISGQIRKRIW